MYYIYVYIFLPLELVTLLRRQWYLIYICCLKCWQLSYVLCPAYLTTESGGIILRVTYALEALLILDIFVTLRTAIVTPNGEYWATYNTFSYRITCFKLKLFYFCGNIVFCEIRNFHSASDGALKSVHLGTVVLLFWNGN